MYFDPGFGSMVIQFLVGGVAFAGIVLASLRHKIAVFFGWKPKVDETTESTDDDGFEQVDEDA